MLVDKGDSLSSVHEIRRLIERVRVPAVVLYLKNLVSLGPFGNGKFEAFGTIDFIHGILDTLIRIKICNQSLKNLIPICLKNNEHSIIPEVVQRHTYHLVSGTNRDLRLHKRYYR